MELSLLTSTASLVGSTSGRAALGGAGPRLGDFSGRRRRPSLSETRSPIRRFRASVERSEGIDGGRESESSGGAGGLRGPAMQVTTFDQSFGEAEFPVWEKIGAVVRLSYGIGKLPCLFLIVNHVSRKSDFFFDSFLQCFAFSHFYRCAFDFNCGKRRGKMNKRNSVALFAIWGEGILKFKQ